MSAKITAITLDGKQKTLTRARAQRLVNSGSHEWQGQRTIREVRHAKSVSPVQNRVFIEYEFDAKYPEPGLGALPGDHPLPYTYPLPYEILKHYQTALLVGFDA